MLVRGPLRQVMALLLLPIGLACLAVPFAVMVLKDDFALFDDTRAWMGAGSTEGAPVVSDVSCTRARRSFASTDRAVSLSGWSCALYLAPASTRGAAQDDPFAGRSWQEGMAEWSRRQQAQLDALKERTRLGRIERMLPGNRTGDLPALRRLSAEGEPPRYGVVWGGGALLWRWLAWLAESVLFIGIGAVLLYVGWRRRKG